MKSIQALREKRAAALKTARRLLQDNPSATWNDAKQAEFDRALTEVGNVDREILGEQLELDAAAARVFGGGGAGGWRDPTTGDVIPVAFAHLGSIKSQLGLRFVGRNADTDRVGLADFLRGISGMRCSPAVTNALSIGTDAAGGFVLPAAVQLDLLEAMAPVSSLLTAGAGVTFLEEGAKSHRIAAMSTIPTAAWRAEGGTVATSDPALRNVDLIPRSLAFQFKVSRELLADAPNIEQACRTVIAQAFAKELDRAGLRGTGTSPEIRGILNTSGIQAVTNGANGASLATTAYANFISALTVILAADGPVPTAAIMSPRSLTVLAGLLDTTNQPRRVPTALEKWKQVATSQVPNNLTVGTSTDCSEIYVGDFSKIIFFLREAVSVQKLAELYAGTGEIGFACHVRADLGVTYPAAMAAVTGVRP